MKKQSKKVITLMLVLTMIVSVFAPYSYASEVDTQNEVMQVSEQTQAPDALITGFSYRYTKADGTVFTDTVSFAAYDSDSSHSQYFDVLPWLDAGTKTVTVFDVTTVEGVDVDLAVTPSSYIVDVSTGKGEIKFDATYNGIRNYYIARFMVNSPFDEATMTVESPMEEGKTSTWILENKPVDYFSGTGLWYADKTNWYPGYAGKEFYDSYLFIRPARDVSSKFDKQSVQTKYRNTFIAEYKAANNDAEPTEQQIATAIEENASYMYRFTAPADGAILLASNADTANVTSSSEYVGNYDEISAAGFVKVSGSPMAVAEWTGRTQYTYEQNSFWHAAGSAAESYTKTVGTKYLYSGTYYDITKNEAQNGVITLMTKPYDYQPVATKANQYAENYLITSYHSADSVNKAIWKKYKADNSDEFAGALSSENSNWFKTLLANYRKDPTGIKPKYIESSDCTVLGIGTQIVSLGNVYKKTFKKGDVVTVPFYYAKPGSSYNPVVFVQWKTLSTDASAASLTTTINGSVPKTEQRSLSTYEYNVDLGYNDTNLVINLVANNHKALVSYTDAQGKPVSNTIVPEGGQTMVVYATVAAEDYTIKTTYKFNVTKKSDTTDYPNFSTTNGSVMIEAEAVVTGTGATIQTASSASDGKYVKLSGPSWPSDPFVSDKNNSSAILAEAPGDIGFELSFDQAGRYSVWMRYIATGSDSVWIDYGAIKARTGEKGYSNLGLTVDTSGGYLWKRVALISESPNANETIRIRTRETGVIVDKFIVTRYLGYTPTGTGTLPDPATTPLVADMSTDKYPVPTVVPTVGEHPRVLFKAEDIPQIKENMKAAENANLVAVFNEYKEKTYTGVLANKDPNYDSKGLETIAAKAFDYAINGNETHGREAITAMKNYAGTFQCDSPGDNCRQKGHVLKNIGQVYDWCYPLLSTADKEDLMYLAQVISYGMEVGFPPDGQTILCGHGGEWQLYRDWLTMAIACYDEYPDAYNLVGGKIFSPESVDYRNWWNQSGTHSQGTSYGPGRLEPELYAHVLIKNMSGAELFNEDDLTRIPYDWIYRRRPDGQLMIDGDDNSQNNASPGAYVSGARDALFLAYVISGDPILKRESIKQGALTPKYGREAIQPIEALILNNPSIGTGTPFDSLPLTTYHASPVGEMIARTGWDLDADSNDVIATMTMNEYNPMNHGHYEAGHFMIYYKGILANDSGWYEMHNSPQHKNYMAQSIAHNTLVIQTPYNTWGNQNQGIDGQGVDNCNGKNFYWIPSSWEAYQADDQNRFAEIMGHEFGPNLQTPEYTYLAGDMANSYTSNYDTDVNEALRHMLFLPTGDEDYPAAFVVFDKIYTNTAGNKKAFLLHSQEEPQVNGNVTTIKRTERDYNGKLVNQTLLPVTANLKIDKIGGADIDENGKVIPNADGTVEGKDKRFWNRGQNWFFMQDDPTYVKDKNTIGRVVNPNNSLEAGWGRVEIMPQTTSNIDYMLNVMYVGSADDNSALQQATLIETDAFAGAKIFDRVAMFSKAKARVTDTVSFTVPGSEQALKVNVAGLCAGTWDITVNGNKVDTQIASEEGGIIYFTAPAGSYTITRVSDYDDKDFGVTYRKLISSFSYEADNGDKKTESFASYDTDGNNAQVIDIMLTEGAKSVTVSDIIENTEVVGGVSLQMTPSNGVVDLSSGKGSVEIYAAYPSTVVATDINKYIINFTVPMTEVEVISPVAQGNNSWKYVNKPLDYTLNWYSNLPTWHVGYVGKKIYDSHLFISVGRSEKTLNKATVQANYKANYLAANPDATETEAAQAVQNNASYLFKFTAPTSGKIILASNVDTNNAGEMASAGFSKIAGKPENASLNVSKISDYTYTKNSYFHAKGQSFTGYTMTTYKNDTTTGKYKVGSHSYNLAVNNSATIKAILTQAYDYIPSPTEANNYAEDYYVSSYHPADNVAKTVWAGYRNDNPGIVSTSLSSNSTNWMTMLDEYKDNPLGDKPVYIESSNAANVGLCANDVVNNVVYTKTFTKGEDVIIPFYYADTTSGYNPIVFVSWDKLSNDTRAESITVNGNSLDTNVYEHTTSVAYEESTVTVEVVAKNAASTVSYTDGDDNALASTTFAAPEVDGAAKVVKVTITAEDGTSVTHTITITRAKSTDVSVKSLTINGELEDTVEDKAIALNYDVETFSVALEANDENATVTYTIDGVNADAVENVTAPEIDGAAKIVVATITAQDGQTSATYTFTFTRKARSTTLNISATEDGGTIKYKLGADNQYTNAGEGFQQETELGTVYRLQAVANSGYEFKYWKVVSDTGLSTVISEEAEIEYSANLNSTLKAVFRNKNSTAKTVVFKNRNGQIVGNYIINSGDAAITITNPSQTGYNFENWLRSDGQVVDKFYSLNYNSTQLGNLKDVIFTAQYSKAETPYAVTVTNGYIYSAGDAVDANKPINGEYTYNTPIEVKTEGEGVFSHWIKGGKIVSYSPQYKFYVTTANTSVEAIYTAEGATPEENTPFINISDMIEDTVNGKIKFFTERYLPEGYTFIGAGLTVSKEQANLGECEKLTASDTVFQWIVKNPNANQFVATKTNAGNYTWYAKAWLIYKDISGSIHTIYSDEENISLSN
ncbi:MAG: hypothetical protein E7410_03865 [Ruminococcaceae bacterium]|nr:hypothetical protein [Oscillospiraceae bacterium]